MDTSSPLTPTTPKLLIFFAHACGVARLAYNWALDEWQKQYEADKNYHDDRLRSGIAIDNTKLNKPSQGKLHKQLNAIKCEQFPFMTDLTKCSPQEAII
ncbi:MAG: helix-turn-helix domain-containing protein [Moraxella sp.]|nr:helix-turn-helix domain-containing protein [Moraxella sp.]